MTKATRCCCGRKLLTDGEPLIVNDYQHETPGEGRFCGPVYKHELRDLCDLYVQLAEVRAEVERMTARTLELEAALNVARGMLLRHHCFDIEPCRKCTPEECAIVDGAAAEKGEPPTCAWTEDRDGAWETECGGIWEFPDGGPSENGARYCCRCGREIEATGYAELQAEKDGG